MQSVTVELSESVYRRVEQLALASHKSIKSILEDSISRTLPPLDDVSPEEAVELAQLASLDDASLWREARQTLGAEQERELQRLLDRQGEDELSARQRARLEQLLERYGEILVRKAHAYLLLARRGYHVPMQEELQ